MNRLPSFSIRVKCDVIKPRKPAIETRPPPVKASQKEKSHRPEPKFAAVKLGLLFLSFGRFRIGFFSWSFLSVLPEQSTEVGDLIQPAPGVFYEDSRLKKGDPRRYQVNITSSVSTFRIIFDFFFF